MLIKIKVEISNRGEEEIWRILIRVNMGIRLIIISWLIRWLEGSGREGKKRLVFVSSHSEVGIKIYPNIISHFTNDNHFPIFSYLSLTNTSNKTTLPYIIISIKNHINRYSFLHSFLILIQSPSKSPSSPQQPPNPHIVLPTSSSF